MMRDRDVEEAWNRVRLVGEPYWHEIDDKFREQLLRMSQRCYELGTQDTVAAALA